MTTKPWDDSVWTDLTANVLTKLGIGLGVGASGVLLFKSSRVRTLWLGVCTGAGGGYAWHQNSAFLASRNPDLLLNPSLTTFVNSVREKIPSIFRIKKE